MRSTTQFTWKTLQSWQFIVGLEQRGRYPHRLWVLETSPCIQENNPFSLVNPACLAKLTSSSKGGGSLGADKEPFTGGQGLLSLQKLFITDRDGAPMRFSDCF